MKVEIVKLWSDKNHPTYFYLNQQDYDQVQYDVVKLTHEDGTVTWALPLPERSASNADTIRLDVPKNEARIESGRKYAEQRRKEARERHKQAMRRALRAGTDTVYCRERIGCDCADCQGYR